MKNFIFTVVSIILASLGLDSLIAKFSPIAKASTQSSPFEMSQPNQDRPDRMQR